MSKNFKVPSFISESFGKLNHEEKLETIERYKRWYDNEFTQALIDEMELTRAALMEEDEKKSDFSSWFQLSYITARNRAKRSLLKELIRKLDYKV